MRGKEGERVTQVVIGFLSRKGNVRRKKKCCNAMKYVRSILEGVVQSYLWRQKID